MAIQKVGLYSSKSRKTAYRKIRRAEDKGCVKSPDKKPKNHD